MNLRSIDLNLLVIFDTLMTESSVKQAAEKVGVTPSAISHALRRLRTTFNDDLLMRTPRGLEATHRGRELAKSVRDALQQLHRAVDQQLNFDPSTSERTFKIHTSIYLVRCLLPRVFARIRAEAPGIGLIFERAALESNGITEPRDIQLRVCADAWGPDYLQTRLLCDRFVVAMRRDHPAASKEMTLERFVALPHVLVSAVADGALDRALDRRGLSRRLAATIPSLAGVFPIIEHSDLCAVLPEPWVRLYSEPGRVTYAAIPLSEMEFTIDMIWHRDDNTDPGHRWLRNLIQQEFALLYLNTAGTVKWKGPFPAHRMQADYPKSLLTEQDSL
jgi:DNA-binding transcriptional LysR family regulator